MNWNDTATVFYRGEYVAVRRLGRFLVAELTSPHRVLSTCPMHGGQHEAIRFVVNHQSCEATAHMERYDELHAIGTAGYHQHVCAALGLAADEVVLMGTAANMNYAAHCQERFAELTVDAIVTAGVQGNATRAADPAAWTENAAGWQPLSTLAGTINTMLFINQPLTPGALARAVVTMTEGKTAALQELAVSSRYSPYGATGTGTDQYSVAAPLSPERAPLTSTSPHVKLGELIGRAVLSATKEALRWQNGLEASVTRSLVHALGRFGLTEARLQHDLASRLNDRQRALLDNNSQALLYEPAVASRAYAYAAVLDRVQHGTLPVAVARDVLREQAAGMASAVAAKPHLWFAFFQQLDASFERPLDAVITALALGWAQKWT